MRIAWSPPSRAWMVAPLAFAVGLAAARWQSREVAPQMGRPASTEPQQTETPTTPAEPAPVCEYDEPLASVIDWDSATGYDDIDGDGDVDCWAGWDPGGSCCYGVELEVRPRCGEKSWFTSTDTSKHDHLELVIVPREAGLEAARPLARALWGDLPIDEPGAWNVHDDPLHVWLLGALAVAPDPWAEPTPGAFAEPVDVRELPRVPGWPDREVATSRRQITLFEAAIAHKVGLIDRETARDAAAVLIAHIDGECERVRVAECSGGGTVWQSGRHLAWKDHGRWWSWIHASEGWWHVDEIACIGNDLVLIRELDAGDSRVTLVDVGRSRAATLAGVRHFSVGAGRGVDLIGDDIVETSGDELRERLSAARARPVPGAFAQVTTE